MTRSQEIGASTPGPWRWEINPKGRTIRLCGGLRPKYDLIVMDFVRWGMTNAQPRFIVGGLMCKAEDFKHVAPNREHHAQWFQLLSHPDANLIAAAPDLLAVAKLATDWFSSVDDTRRTQGDIDCIRDAARAAIAKADGQS